MVKLASAQLVKFNSSMEYPMLNKFDNLLSHLNAEDNDMAAEVRAV